MSLSVYNKVKPSIIYILIIGGGVLILLFFGLISTIHNPKQGKFIKIKKNPELIFNL